MTDRLNKIFIQLPKCNIFADVGCDHGIISYEMIKSGKCKKVIFSDISEKSLNKAKILLSDFTRCGLAEGVVSNGLENVGYCDFALIAGMGGEEIIKIISSAKILPLKIAFQPMHNVEKLRRFIVSYGYKIILDKVFYSDKVFYDFIICEKGKDILTEEEAEFGRTNLIEKPNDFMLKINNEIKKFSLILNNQKLNEKSYNDIIIKLEKLKKYV